MKKIISFILIIAMTMSIVCISPFSTFAMKNAVDGFSEVSFIDFENVTEANDDRINGTADISGCKYIMFGTDGGSDTATGKTEWVKYSDITGYEGLYNAKNGTLASPAKALARSVLPVPGGP